MTSGNTAKPSPTAIQADHTPRRIGLITGLADERAILADAIDGGAPGRDWPRLLCAGADARRAEQQAKDLIAAGADGLVSVGVTGGLDPALRPGRVLLPDAIRGPDDPDVPADSAWHAAVHNAFTRAGLDATAGTLLGTRAPVTTANAKARLFADTGAVAVDMESAAVAGVAAARGVPVLALRAVADPAERSLPGLVDGAVTPDGRGRPGLIALRLCAQPWRLPALLQLRRDYGLALTALKRAVGIAGDALLGGG